MTEPAPARFDLPPALSTIASDIDWIYTFIWWVSAFFFVVITGLVILFIVKYRRSKGHRPEPTGHNTLMELAWTFLPLILLGYLFHEGFQGYMRGAVAPANSLPIRVRAMQWSWEFEHPNGVIQLNELMVPVNRPVKLIMSSSDVIHSFFVPAFRVKRDVVPGMYTTTWFEATQQGEMQVYCTEYCGAPPNSRGNAGHSAMLAMVKVVDEKTYEDFLEEGPPAPPECEQTPNPAACWGERLYSQSGCNACHNVDGVAQRPAPNFRGLYGQSRPLADGTSVTADENYIRESILQPQAKIRAGYTDVVMPPYRFSDRQIDALIAYIRSLNGQ